MDLFNEKELELRRMSAEKSKKMNAQIYKNGCGAGASNVPYSEREEYRTATESYPADSLPGAMVRPAGIIQRAQMIVNEHAHNSDRTNRADELLYLAKKYPEFARFYDLATQL